MTFNRDIKRDIQLTNNYIRNKIQDPTNSVSWLDHKGGGAILDYELLKGATLDKLAKKSGRKLSSVAAHISHLKKEHGLEVLNDSGTYRILVSIKEGGYKTKTSRNFLDVEIPLRPPKELRVLVDYLLSINEAKSIDEIVVHLRRSEINWLDSKNLKGRVKRSLDNSVESILANDQVRGKSRQSRVFSIDLQYENLKVLKEDNKYRLKLVSGSIPIIRTNDLSVPSSNDISIKNNPIQLCESSRNEPSRSKIENNMLNPQRFNQVPKIEKSKKPKNKSWFKSFLNGLFQSDSVSSSRNEQVQEYNLESSANSNYESNRSSINLNNDKTSLKEVNNVSGDNKNKKDNLVAEAKIKSNELEHKEPTDLLKTEKSENINTENQRNVVFDKEMLNDVFAKHIKGSFQVLSLESILDCVAIKKKSINKIQWVIIKSLSSEDISERNTTSLKLDSNKDLKRLVSRDQEVIPIAYDIKNDVYLVWDPIYFSKKINEFDAVYLPIDYNSHDKLLSSLYTPLTSANSPKVYVVNSFFLGKFLSNCNKYFEELPNQMEEDQDSSNVIEWSGSEIEDLVQKPFKVGVEYGKTDIYELLNVPKIQQGGKWNNGYCQHDENWFIFTNIGMSGKGLAGSRNEGKHEKEFDYDNRIDNSGNLLWEARNQSQLRHESIQKLKNSKPYIFIRTKNTTKNKWEFIGQGVCEWVEDVSPVKFKWRVIDPLIFKSSNHKNTEKDYDSIISTQPSSSKHMKRENDVETEVRKKFFNWFGANYAEKMQFNPEISIKTGHRFSIDILNNMVIKPY